MAAFGIITSAAITRPLPSRRGRSCCEITPWRTSESCARTCACWCGGKTSMMRLMVWTAEFVCRVENTRWPVSATTSAASMVSRSRISPISTMSGSWRSTCLSACAKPWVSANTSRWLMRQLLCSWTNSIGSSIVMMCSWRSVDLVDEGRERRRLAAARGPGAEHEAAGQLGEPGHRRRQAEAVQLGHLVGDHAERRAGGVILLVEVAAEAGRPLDAEGEVELVLLLEALLLPLGEEAVAEVLRVGGAERRVGEGDEPAVEPDHGGASVRDVQVGRTALDHLPQERLDRWHRAAKSRARATRRGTCRRAGGARAASGLCRGGRGETRVNGSVQGRRWRPREGCSTVRT